MADCVKCGTRGGADFTHTCTTPVAILGCLNNENAYEIGAREERQRVVAFIRARVRVLDTFLREGGDEHARTVHSAQILALHEAARLIETGEDTWR